MSANNPGIIYDATNSWNGYNHQGKISLWYAIAEITKLYNTDLSIDKNKANLASYFLEIEHMEDFSVGKIENEVASYISVHQVKNLADNSINQYESAILGLLAHLSEYPNIKLAMLHTTEDVSLSGKSLLDHIKEFTHNPKYLIDAETKVTKKRNDKNFREGFTTSKKGRPSIEKVNLKNALAKKYSYPIKLTDSNLDEAFDLYLQNINAEKTKLSSLPENQLKKVSISTYPFNGTTITYCSVDHAVHLLKSAIKGFYQKVYPGGYKTGDRYIEKSYLWMLGKLDDHIIDRDLNYDLYREEKRDRKIPFSLIFEWLISSNIDNSDSWFYLHHIKEGMFRRLERYCKTCNKQNIQCSDCNVTECKNKLGCLPFDNFKTFIHITNPTVSGILDMESFPKYLGIGINDPFARGLRDIPKSFDFKGNAVSYKDSKNSQFALTTIVGEGLDNDKAIISSEIIKNSNIYDLLMDYDCLISKDINIVSIMDEEILQNLYHDSRSSEHIAHCKNVKIVALQDFIQSL